MRVGEISVRVLNQETSKVLARVKGGEEIVLTERGRVIARIVPATTGPLAELIGSGAVQPATLHGPAPRPTVEMCGTAHASEVLERMRNDERY